MPFNNPILGGDELIRPDMHSPNYVPGQSGWAIKQDGSAEFQDVLLPTSAKGVQVTFAGTAPASPNTGDLWYDTANGLQVSQWNGSSWTPYQLGTSAIAPGTITAAQLAAGIVYAGIVNGTTITGATLVATGTSGDVLCYNGTPTSGNLILSFSPVSGTDPYGNAYTDGLVVYRGTAKLQLHINSTVGAPAVDMPTGVASEAGNAALYTYPVNVGQANEFLNTWLQGPASTYDNHRVGIALTSAAKDGSVGSAGYLEGNGTNIAYWDAGGVHVISNLYGTSGVLSIGDQIARPGKISGYPLVTTGANNTNTAITGTSFSKLSLVWTIPANDAQVGTIYRVKTRASGTTPASGGPALKFQVNHWGTTGAAGAIGGVAYSGSVDFWLELEAEILILSAGTSGQAISMLRGSWSIQGVNWSGISQAQNSIGFNAQQLAAINTTAGSNITIQAAWSSSNSGQQVYGNYDVFERGGP